MSFTKTPEVDFSSVGLITDVPSHSLPQGAWSDCLNIRCKDGSVQGVNVFEDGFPLFTSSNTGIRDGKAMAVTQFLEAGGNNLVIAYIVKDASGDGHVVTYNTGTSTYLNLTNALTPNQFTFDDRYPPQIYVFNELLIVNPANDAPPMFSDDVNTAGSLVTLPNWPSDSHGSKLVTRILKPFNNRLMAMNIFEEHQATADDDEFLPIDILWSSHITGIGSIDAVEWSYDGINTAGDAFAVETPGKILDGGQLGEYFIAYKTDAVIRVRETGDTYVLAFESIFEDDGIYSARCFANIGNAQHLVIGNYGVYLHDGQSQKEDIAKGLFQDVMFNSVKATKKDKSFCFQQTRDKEVWFCFPSKTISGDGCDRAFVFDYSTRKLHLRSLPNISDAFETEQNGELKIYAAKEGAAAEIQILSSTVFEENGFFIRVNDNYKDSAYKWINAIHLDSMNSVQISVVGTNSITDTAVYSLQTFNPTTDYKLDFRTSGRYMNIKVQMLGASNPLLGRMQFELKVAGKR